MWNRCRDIDTMTERKQLDREVIEEGFRIADDRDSIF
jgi:hypothetical protein